MDTSIMREMFKILKEMYDEKKIELSFSKNSYSIGISENNYIEEENKDNFKQFSKNFIKALREKIINGSCDNEYIQFVDEFIEKYADIKSEIISKTLTNVNTITSVESEILTKREKNLKDILSYSVLVNLNYKEPKFRDSQFECINFELSIKDLKEIKKSIEDILEIISDLEK